jgi:hypothetical protein
MNQSQVIKLIDVAEGKWESGPNRAERWQKGERKSKEMNKHESSVRVL